MEWILIGIGFLIAGIFVVGVLLPALAGFLVALVWGILSVCWLLTWPFHRGGGGTSGRKASTPRPAVSQTHEMTTEEQRKADKAVARSIRERAARRKRWEAAVQRDRIRHPLPTPLSAHERRLIARGELPLPPGQPDPLIRRPSWSYTVGIGDPYTEGEEERR